MMPMKLLYTHGDYVGAYEKHEKTKIRIRIGGGDWHMWVESTAIGFYYVMSRM